MPRQIMGKVWGEERVGAHVWLPQFLFSPCHFSSPTRSQSPRTVAVFLSPEGSSPSWMLAQSARRESELTSYKTTAQLILKLWTLTVNFLFAAVAVKRKKPAWLQRRWFCFCDWSLKCDIVISVLDDLHSLSGPRKTYCATLGLQWEKKNLCLSSFFKRKTNLPPRTCLPPTHHRVCGKRNPPLLPPCFSTTFLCP